MPAMKLIACIIQVLHCFHVFIHMSIGDIQIILFAAPALEQFGNCLSSGSPALSFLLNRINHTLFPVISLNPHTPAVLHSHKRPVINGPLHIQHTALGANIAEKLRVVQPAQPGRQSRPWNIRKWRVLRPLRNGEQRPRHIDQLFDNVRVILMGVFVIAFIIAVKLNVGVTAMIMTPSAVIPS